MFTLQAKRFRLMALGSLFALALVSAPASAHHDHNIIGPVVTFIALGALLHHSGHSHHGHHGHYSYQYKKKRRHNHRRHSHSHGGYHGHKRGYSNNW